MTEHRWSKFWWQDYERDPALRMCGLASQGLWMRLLCYMHEGTPYGHLTVNGKSPSPRQIAAIVSAPEKDVVALLSELEDAGVFSRNDQGVIFCRRMVRDKAVTDQAAENGKRGGNPKLKGGHNPSLNGTGKPPPITQGVNPPPYTLEAEAESERKKELAAPVQTKPAREPRMPSRSDPPDAWAMFVSKWEVDDRGVKRPVMAGEYLDLFADRVLEAAKINDANWRGDWRPIIAWLQAGYDPERIIEIIRETAARPNYNPPRTLEYFSKRLAEVLGNG